MKSYTRRSGYAVEHVLPERLLRAAILDDERAVEEWKAWQPLVNEDDLDEGSHSDHGFEIMNIAYRDDIDFD